MARGRPPLPVGTWGEIRTYQRKKGWIARALFRDFDGRTREVSRTGKTKGAAKSALTEALTKRTAPIEGAEIEPSTQLSVICERYHAHKIKQEKWAITTQRRYREVLDTYITPRIGGLRASEITVGRLEAFFQAVSDEIGPPSAKHCRSFLSGALGMAVRHGALTANPVRETEVMDTQAKEIHTLELEQIAELRKIAILRDQPSGTAGRNSMPSTAAIVDTLLGTGARIGEVLAIRKQEDLDLTAGTVRISGTVIRDQNGKMVRQDHTKNRTVRILQLPRFTLDTLTIYTPTVPPTFEDLLFPSTVGTVRDPNNFRKVWRKMIEKAELPKGVTPHTLRKTVATAIDRETDLRSAASQLGDDERTAAKHYVKRDIMGPDVATLLQGLVAPPMKIVKGSSA